ncbi:MAG: SpoIIE family protein phosphatase [Xanthomonadales bacterium]|nr:SpoIIE family protein phosphatase [Xanthomonadales bacterium]
MKKDTAPRLRSVEGLTPPIEFELLANGTLGRDPAADFRLDHPTVSRRHADIRVEGRKVEVTDLGSANGSRINGRALGRTAHLLADGDMVQFGQVLFEYTHQVGATVTTGSQEKTVRPSVDAKRARMMQSDLRLARRIQYRLLPDEPPPLPGYEIDFSYTPALAIGGDFYDVRTLPSGELAVTIGDVSGKGVSGAMYMVFTCAVLRARLATSKGPAEFLTELNQRICPVIEPGMFLTVATMFLNPTTHVCRLALAGHNPPVLRSASKKVVEMSLDPGHPIGSSPDLSIRDQRFQLTPGDVMLFTTDGVEEGENPAGEPFGNERRNQVMRGASGALDMNRRLRSALLQFCEADVSTDDFTIIAVERLSEEAD